MPAKTKTVKRARTARPAKLTARALLYDNERIVHRAGCKEISACACPVFNQYNLPLDNDHNCICSEAPKPHAQHKPADPIEPGCQGADCTDGTCSMCAAVPDDQWIAWKRVAHAPKVKRPSVADEKPCGLCGFRPSDVRPSAGFVCGVCTPYGALGPDRRLKVKTGVPRDEIESLHARLPEMVNGALGGVEDEVLTEAHDTAAETLLATPIRQLGVTEAFGATFPVTPFLSWDNGEVSGPFDNWKRARLTVEHLVLAIESLDDLQRAVFYTEIWRRRHEAKGGE